MTTAAAQFAQEPCRAGVFSPIIQMTAVRPRESGICPEATWLWSWGFRSTFRLSYFHLMLTVRSVRAYCLLALCSLSVSPALLGS